MQTLAEEIARSGHDAGAEERFPDGGARARIAVVEDRVAGDRGRAV